mmetsp:Transcript_32943/g.97234  ORF Transcript_32943/g.97234 Transcript_32943/m.97234 type:complete len:355 (-) Transcript_32943:120-1184(-)
MGLCSCISSLVTLVMLAVTGYLLWHFLGKPQTVDEAIASGGEILSNLGDVLDNFSFDDFDFSDMFGDFDPNGGGGGGDYTGGSNKTLTWDLGQATENGLTLTLKNNLDENWQDEYRQAVANWMDSDPGIVQLESIRVEDYLKDKCNPQDGLMMVCNGNEGDNGMLGFNNLVFDQKGVIFSSVAVMNEYYLANADWDERLYTMCHELGHGLGLDHTDEDPYNKDQGNCMDYTDNPSANILPGAVNFARLRSIYGEVSRRLGSSLRRMVSSVITEVSRDVPHNLEQAYDDAMADLKRHVSEEYHAAKRGEEAIDEDRRERNLSGWRRLHQNKWAGHFVRELVDGYKIQTSVLYPRE